MLSILTPSRNEDYLRQTVDDIFKHAEGDIEVLVALDNWENPPELKPEPRLRIIKTAKGQRGATNELARIAKGEYLMKTDAHVSFSRGFDLEVLKALEGATVAVPALCNLHVYDFLCSNGHRQFQGLFDKCEFCGNTEYRKELIWRPRPKPTMTNYYFDSGFRFHYAQEQDESPITETMTIQGSCFTMRKEDYWRIKANDEIFGSWGQQGNEVAIKTWLSGGRVVSTRNCYYAHEFREIEGFPYPNPSKRVLECIEQMQDLFMNNKWKQQIHPLIWLLEKFDYPGNWWHSIALKKLKPWK